MKSRFKVWIIALFILSITAPAIAAEKENTSLLIFSGGRSVARNACASPLVTLEADSGFQCDNQPDFYRTAYNYKFTPAWGVEISVGDIGRTHGVGSSSGDPYSYQFKADGWTVAGVGFLNIGKSFSLFGKLGVVNTRLQENAHRNFSGTWFRRVIYPSGGVPVTNEEKHAPIYGVGFQFDFAKHVGLRFQYEHFGQYDIFSAYGVSTPEKIILTATSLGLVVGF